MCPNIYATHPVYKYNKAGLSFKFGPPLRKDLFLDKLSMGNYQSINVSGVERRNELKYSGVE